MALLQLTIIPMGAGISVADYVYQMQKSLEREGATFRLNDMGTVIEGDINDLLALLRKVYETPFNNGAKRVITNIVIDDRRDIAVHIGDKIISVTKKDL